MTKFFKIVGPFLCTKLSVHNFWRRKIPLENKLLSQKINLCLSFRHRNTPLWQKIGSVTEIFFCHSNFCKRRKKTSVTETSWKKHSNACCYFTSIKEFKKVIFFVDLKIFSPFVANSCHTNLHTFTEHFKWDNGRKLFCGALHRTIHSKPLNQM